MGLETGTTISSFITSNPTSSDPVNQGDDHLRLIKSVLQTQFPGSGGLGFSIPITATEAEINGLHGLTNFYFASGTKLSFFQATAPAGWTQIVTYANHMLRVVSGVGGGVGGTDSPILNNTSVPAHTHIFTGGTHTHTLTDPGHSHQQNGNNGLCPGGGSQVPLGAIASGYYTQSATTGITIASASSSGTNANNAVVSWTPQYLDNILCSKN